MDEANAAILKAQGIVVLLESELPVLQKRISGQGNRPSLTGQDTAVGELATVWETRRERYYAVADLTYDVSAESSDPSHDVRQKAEAIHALLLNHLDGRVAETF